MTEVKEKQKRAEPVLMHSANQAFMDGHLQHPVNSQQIKDAFAHRYHLSTVPSLQGRLTVAGCGLFILLPLTLFISWGAYGAWRQLLNNFTTLNLLGSIVVQFVALALIVLLYWIGVSVFRYNPDKVNRLYNDWLKRGEIIHGEFGGYEYERGKVVRINYRFYMNDGKRYSGSLPAIPTLNSQLVNGTPIYILYADKKLHAPL